MKSTKLEGIDFLREKVRERDGFTCQICKKVWQEGQRRFDVHHLDPEYEGKKANYKLDKQIIDRLITLCHKCHLGLPHIRLKLSTTSNPHRGKKEEKILNLFNQGVSFKEISKSTYFPVWRVKSVLEDFGIKLST